MARATLTFRILRWLLQVALAVVILKLPGARCPQKAGHDHDDQHQ